MPLDFPSSPTNGQVYGNYYYNSARGAWNALLPAATPNFFTNANLNTPTLVDAVATSSLLSTTPLTIKGVSGQTANLQEWKDPAGAILASISSAGILNINTSGTGILNLGDGQISKASGSGFSFNSGFTNVPYIGVNASGSQTTKLNINTGAATNIGVVIKASASQTADLQQWQSSTGAVLSEINSAGELQVPRMGIGSVMPTTTMLHSTASAVGNIPIVARGAASQTANLQEWQDSTAAVKASISPAGALTLATPLTIANGGTGNINGAGGIPMVATSTAVNAGSASTSAAGVVTFSGVTTLGLNGIFNSNYEHYRVIVTNYAASSAGANQSVQLRAAGTTLTAATYQWYGYRFVSWSNAAIAGNGAGSWYMMESNTQSSPYYTSVMDFISPFNSAEYTRYINSSYIYAGQYGMAISNGMIGTAASYDGLTLNFTAASSGSVRVYGYK